jgi:hypothetical protein
MTQQKKRTPIRVTYDVSVGNLFFVRKAPSYTAVWLRGTESKQILIVPSTDIR